MCNFHCCRFQKTSHTSYVSFTKYGRESTCCIGFTGFPPQLCFGVFIHSIFVSLYQSHFYNCVLLSHVNVYVLHMLSYNYYSYPHYIYVIVRTHFTVITCFNVARGRVNKGRVYIMHEPKASALCKRDLY